MSMRRWLVRAIMDDPLFRQHSFYVYFRAKSMYDAYDTSRDLAARTLLDHANHRGYKGKVGRRVQGPPLPPSGKRGERVSPEREFLMALRMPISGARELIHVMVTLPRAHVRVLDTEAG